MNLFILDECPIQSARQYCDDHHTKIILEAAQCMCAAHWEHGFPLLEGAPLPLIQGKYRGRTHHNNHVTRWVRETSGNYKWCADHAIELCDEYERRYHVRTNSHREHASREIVEWLARHKPYGVPFGPMTEFRQAVAEECYHENPVVAYWVYYAVCKHTFATWRYSETPSWYLSLTQKRLDGFSVGQLLKHAEKLYEASKQLAA